MLTVGKVVTVLLGLSLIHASTGAQPHEKAGNSLLAVQLANGVTVKIPRPEAQGWPDNLQEWGPPEVKFTPDRKFAAVIFKWSIPKYKSTKVYLAGPDGQAKELKNGDINSLEWSKDSKFILGFGDTVFRIWDLSGKRKQITGGTIVNYVYYGNRVCIETVLYPQPSVLSGSADQLVYVRERFDVPSLRKISSMRSGDVLHCEHRP